MHFWKRCGGTMVHCIYCYTAGLGALYSLWDTGKWDMHADEVEGPNSERPKGRVRVWCCTVLLACTHCTMQRFSGVWELIPEAAMDLPELDGSDELVTVYASLFVPLTSKKIFVFSVE